MSKGITFVGMDVHKKAIQVAMLLPGHRVPVEWQVAHEPAAVRRMAKKILRETGAKVQACYEAGPCGYALQRQLRTLAVSCQVIAPSLIPVKPGDRVKTDRRDARKLAEMLRAGLLTEVHPPSEDEEAIRDLCRCREDAQEDLTRCRHRLTKMLLRRGMRFQGTSRNWTQAHRLWLRTLRFDREVDQAVFEDYLLAIEHLEERLQSLNTRLEAHSHQAPYREPVGWLRCFRGIDTVTAMTVVAELHDFRRFRSARGLMAFLGMVPSEYSSSDRIRRGSITKTGNRHVRRVLVEAAWHYRHSPAIGVRLRQRRRGQPPRILALADKAQQRLHRRFSRLTYAGKPKQKVVVAVARELAGFLWCALATSTPVKG